jgi:uncharacterized SAM-binding protein YcdF (DUF218 family)
MGLFVSRLVANFLLPPGLFILLCLAAGIITILILKSREARTPAGKRFLYILLILCLSNALLIYLGSIVPTAALLNAPLERSYRGSYSDAGAAGDCVVVLGGGIDAVRRADGELHYTPSRSSVVRLSEAASLYYGNPDLQLAIIVSGGILFNQTRAESEVYAEFLQRLGIPKQRLHLETRSRNTLENALYVQSILQQRGWNRPLLITTANHMNRALWTFQRLGIEAIPVATDFTETPARLCAADLLPDSRAAHNVKSALWEYVGLLWYRLLLLREGSTVEVR